MMSLRRVAVCVYVCVCLCGMGSERWLTGHAVATINRRGHLESYGVTATQQRHSQKLLTSVKIVDWAVLYARTAHSMDSVQQLWSLIIPNPVSSAFWYPGADLILVECFGMSNLKIENNNANLLHGCSISILVLMVAMELFSVMWVYVWYYAKQLEVRSLLQAPRHHH